jgi:hypothetical protein
VLSTHGDIPSDGDVTGCDPNIIACGVKTFLTPGRVANVSDPAVEYLAFSMPHKSLTAPRKLAGPALSFASFL